MSNSTIYNGEKPQGSQTYFSGYARPEKRLETYPIPPPDTPELIMSPELQAKNERFIKENGIPTDKEIQNMINNVFKKCMKENPCIKCKPFTEEEKKIIKEIDEERKEGQK